VRHPMFKPAAVVAGLAIVAGAAVGTADAQTGAGPAAVSAAPAAVTSRTIFLATGERLLAHLANAGNCVGIVGLGSPSRHGAAITGSNGSYAASFDAPADSLVSLRATASDANGSAVTETISNAYQVAYQG
jgi:hypothetical protein